MELPLPYPDSFEEAVALVLRAEGGYIDDPADPGGRTKFGISQRAFPAEDIKNMTEARARLLYLAHYWIPIRTLPPHLRYIVFDAAVNIGVERAVKILQRMAGCVADGKVGPTTCRRAESISVEAYLKEREKYYRAVVKIRPASQKFLSGWMARLKHVRAAILSGLRGT
jgi:lysozyme family protein